MINVRFIRMEKRLQTEVLERELPVLPPLFSRVKLHFPDKPKVTWWSVCGIEFDFDTGDINIHLLRSGK